MIDGSLGRGAVRSPPATYEGYRNILVVIDPGACPTSALEYAGSLSVRANAHLTILTVVSPLPALAHVTGMALPSFESDAIAAAERTLRTAVMCIDASVPVHTRLRRGDPAKQIWSQVKESAHDLVVVSSTRHRRLINALGGSGVGRGTFRLTVPMCVVGS